MHTVLRAAFFGLSIKFRLDKTWYFFLKSVEALDIAESQLRRPAQWKLLVWCAIRFCFLRRTKVRHFRRNTVTCHYLLTKANVVCPCIVYSRQWVNSKKQNNCWRGDWKDCVKFAVDECKFLQWYCLWIIPGSERSRLTISPGVGLATVALYSRQNWDISSAVPRLADRKNIPVQRETDQSRRHCFKTSTKEVSSLRKPNLC